jgi:archaellum component FlaC
VALIEKHRLAIYENLSPIVGEEATEALLAEIPHHESDQPVTRAYLDARLDERFGELEGRLEGRFTSIDERFTSIEKRFTSIDERFTSIDERFAEMEQRFTTIDRRFDRLDVRFEQMTTEMWRLQHRTLAALGAMITVAVTVLSITLG